MKTIKAWWFCNDKRELGYGDGRKIVEGETLSIKDTSLLRLCDYGMHASKSIMDALSFQKGNVVCRVELSGKMIEGDDKIVAEHRKILWMCDIEKLLRKFAIHCAIRVVDRCGVKEIIEYATLINLLYEENGYTYIDYAADSAADSAACSAVAAADSAADSAAYSTAYYAADYPAYYAAYSATRSAAYSAADSATEKKIQEKYLIELINNKEKENED